MECGGRVFLIHFLKAYTSSRGGRGGDGGGGRVDQVYSCVFVNVIVGFVYTKREQLQDLMEGKRKGGRRTQGNRTYYNYIYYYNVKCRGGSFIVAEDRTRESSSGGEKREINQ